jgi:outer membrane protein OmpA-like peptidoglycan-associated protein
MKGRNEWRIQTAWGELVLRVKAAAPDSRGSRANSGAAFSRLMLAMGSGVPEVIDGVRSLHATIVGPATNDPAPAHHAVVPYWREFAHIEQDLLQALRTGTLTIEALKRQPGPPSPVEEEPPAPPPAPRNKSSSEPSPYDVKVIDDTGAAVAGIDVNLTIDGAPETIKTSGGGTAHSEGHTGSIASLKMLDVTGLPAKLEAKWKEPRAKNLPKGLDVQEVVAGRPFEPLSVRPNAVFTLIVTRPPVRRVRLSGLLFDANKSFLLPQALPGIRTIVAVHRDYPSAKLLVVGHAEGDEERAGPAIALERARALIAFITNQPLSWLQCFGAGTPARARWGTREVQLMLSALSPSFYSGYASGMLDAKTKAALISYQKQRGLVADGRSTPATLKKLVADYMSIEDTTLISDVDPVPHGSQGHTDEDLTAAGLQPDERRLEVFFFEGKIVPEPAGEISPAASPVYRAWRRNVVETRDYEHHGIHVQVVDQDKQPMPFANVKLSGPTSDAAMADEHGFVSFFGLQAGDYTLTAERAGCTVIENKLSYPTAKTVPGHRYIEESVGSPR